MLITDHLIWNTIEYVWTQRPLVLGSTYKNIKSFVEHCVDSVSGSKLEEWSWVKIEIWIQIEKKTGWNCTLGDFHFMVEVLEGVSPSTSNILKTSRNCVMNPVGKFYYMLGDINATTIWGNCEMMKMIIYIYVFFLAHVHLVSEYLELFCCK